MILPKENIWQDLRSTCLSTIPEGSKVEYLHPVSLAGWRQRGYYTVTGVSAKRFELVASSADLGGAILTDVEHYLDQASEQQVTLWRHINSAEWLSPAWIVVTFYYWAFYLVLAVTRLLGTCTWFLTRSIVRDLCRLGPHGAPRGPGAGCFRLTCGPDVSATEREVRLIRRDGRVHDDAWQTWFEMCRDRLAALAVGSSTSLEERLFAAISRSSLALGTGWPSEFRNLVNYRAGFAYSAVRKERVLESFAYLREPRSYSAIALIEQLERHTVRAPTVASLLTSPDVIAMLLVDHAFVLHAFATELYADLVERRGLDQRWQQRRQRFLRQHSIASDAGLWPS